MLALKHFAISKKNEHKGVAALNLGISHHEDRLVLLISTDSHMSPIARARESYYGTEVPHAAQISWYHHQIIQAKRPCRF